MSLCVYERIEGKIFNEKSLKTCLNNYFSNGYETIKENDDCAAYEIKNNEGKAIVSFISEKKYPYNIYDSDIINDEFEYHQLLIFELNKEDATMDFYIEIIKFLKYLFQETKSRILVTSDAHDEICLLNDKDILWSTNNALIKEFWNDYGNYDKNRRI